MMSKFSRSVSEKTFLTHLNVMRHWLSFAPSFLYLLTLNRNLLLLARARFLQRGKHHFCGLFCVGKQHLEPIPFSDFGINFLLVVTTIFYCLFSYRHSFDSDSVPNTVKVTLGWTSGLAPEPASPRQHGRRRHVCRATDWIRRS